MDMVRAWTLHDVRCYETVTGHTKTVRYIVTLDVSGVGHFA
jgi:hypothetical protein